MNLPKFLQPIFWNEYNISQQKKLLKRPSTSFSNNLQKQVENILNQVYKYGDDALKKFNLCFDNFTKNNLKISKSQINMSSCKLSTEFKEAINTAMNNIKNFHVAQKISDINIEILPGVTCKQIIRPLTSVGLYIPSGSAPLPSTVLMLGIPAQIAGCKRIIICSPPPISNEILYVAHICGIQEIYQLGGAQAIAAMGFGTQTITKVDKIFGPGNIWVTEAKRQIRYKSNIAIDMLAGPSEILIIADNQANPSFIASDLLAQAEHGPNSQVILLTPEIHIVHAVIHEINKQIQNLSRANIIMQALKNSRFIVCKNLMECTIISNIYAPEHLMIHTHNPENWLKYIINAGSIFLGQWSPESAGDYASGTNHVLPTYGYTKNTSSLGLSDFQKRMTVQQLTKHGLLQLSPTIITLSEIEQLTAHKESVKIRINTNTEDKT